MNCLECDASMCLPNDAMAGELVTCPECGISFELVGDRNGRFNLSPAPIQGEDWGE